MEIPTQFRAELPRAEQEQEENYQGNKARGPGKEFAKQLAQEAARE